MDESLRALTENILLFDYQKSNLPLTQISLQIIHIDSSLFIWTLDDSWILKQWSHHFLAVGVKDFSEDPQVGEYITGRTKERDGEIWAEPCRQNSKLWRLFMHAQNLSFKC